MDIKKIIFISIFLLAIVTIGAVSAEDNVTLENFILESAHNDSQVLCEYPESISVQSSSDSGDEIIKENSSEVENSDSSNSGGSENFTIKFYDDYHLYGDTNIFGFLMPNDIENNVSVEIDGKPYDYEIYDINNRYLWVWGGDAQTQMGYMVKFSDLSLGDHNVIITYPGDSHYAESSLVKSITVHDGYKLLSKLTVTNLNAYYNSGKCFIATLMDENGNLIPNAEIKMDFNGKNKILKTDKNGQVKLITNNLAPKSYNVALTYLGNDYFTNSTVKAKITIKKIIPKITAFKKTFKKSLKTKKYTITLKANNKAMKNTKVYLKIKGKTYAAKTNKYGKATFKITKFTKKGTFKATVKYAGSRYYSAKTANTKITCK